MSQLQLEWIKLEGGIAVAVLNGRLVLGSRLSLLEAEFTSAISAGTRKLVLDFAQIEYVDSAALGVLLHTSGSLRSKGGLLVLAAPNQRIQSLFEMTNTSSLIPSFPDRDKAVSSLLSSPH